MSKPSYIKRGSTRHSDDSVDDYLSVSLDGRDDTKRKSRNLSEKRRRDQFNLLINELNNVVTTDTRKMDKSTVLKSTISFLKNHNANSVKSLAYEIGAEWKPSFLPNEQFAHLILEAIDGFILIFSVSGQILYASESITSLLGHLPRDLAKETMYDLVHENDHSQLYNLVLNTGCLNKQDDSNETQVLLSCHVRRGDLDSSHISSYELVQFQGFIRNNSTGHTVTDASLYLGEPGAKLLFVGTGKLQVPLLMPDIAVVDASKSEFTSRHSLEWKFLFLDHRASPIIGYLPFEVLGTSGYDYYHVDDLDNVVACHEALISKGEGTSCHYRFLMKGQQWIWLQTRFYITYHQWNSKPEFIVCTHRVVSCGDVFHHQRTTTDPGVEDDSDSDDGNEELDKLCKTKPRPAAWLATLCHGRSARSDPTSTDSATFQNAAPSNQSRSCAPLQQKLSPLMQPSETPLPQSQQPSTVDPSSFLEPHHYAPVLAPALVIATTQPLIQAPTLMTSGSPCHVQSPLVMTSSQVQTQEQLQRKHQQLQALIQAQQEELRRVSEQLLMAQFGVVNTATSTSSAGPLPEQQRDLLSPGVMLDLPDGNNDCPPEQFNFRGQASDEGGTPYELLQQQAGLVCPSLNTTTQHTL